MAADIHYTIGVLGPHKSGKTILYACLFDTLMYSDSQPRGYGTSGQRPGTFEILDEETARYIDTIIDKLKQGVVPDPTIAPQELAITFTPDSQSNSVEYRFKDYRGADLHNRWQWGQVINKILDTCDAVVLLIDTEALLEQTETSDNRIYLEALIEIVRRRRARMPVQVLFSKNDLYEDEPDAKLAAAIRRILDFVKNTQLPEQAPHPLLEFLGRQRLTSSFRISCARIRMQSKTTFRRDGDPSRKGGFFQPDNVAAAFTKLDTQLEYVRRQRRRARLVTWGILPGAILVALITLGLEVWERREYESLRSRLATAESTELQQARANVESFAEQWSWLSWLFGRFREHLERVRGTVSELVAIDGAEKGREAEAARLRALSFLELEPDDMPRRDAAFYDSCISLIQEVERLVEALPAELQAGLTLCRQKKTYVNFSEAVRQRPVSERPDVVDGFLGTEDGQGLSQRQRDELRRLASEQREQVRLRQAYEAALACVPRDLEQARAQEIQQALQCLSSWPQNDAPPDPGHPFIEDIRRRIGGLHLAQFKRAFHDLEDDHAKNSQLPPTFKLRAWEELLERFPDNPIMPSTWPEGRAEWDDYRTKAHNLVRQYAADIKREQEARAKQEQEEQALRDQISRAEKEFASLRDRQWPDEVTAQAYLSFLSKYEKVAAVAVLVTAARNQWEAVAYSVVRDRFENFRMTRVMPPNAVISAQDWYMRYAFQFQNPGHESYIRAVGEFMAWVQTPTTLTIRVQQQQGDRLYAKISSVESASVVQLDTSETRSPVEIPGYQVLENLAVEYFWDDWGPDTMLGTDTIDLLTQEGPKEYAHRNQRIIITIDSKRPVLPPTD